MAGALSARIAPIARAVLKRGREGPVRGGNPWIFSQAIERIEPASIEAGAPVTVHDASGALLGMGYCNPATTIAIRMLAWGEAPAIEELVARRLSGALELRRRFIRDDTNSYRLVNGDGDGLSGVVIDRFGEVLVVQILTAGADRMRATIVAALSDLLHPRSIIERSHGAVRKQEGLDDHAAVLAGDAVSETIAAENGTKIKIDFEHGQKTGYFLDQRDNRAMAGRIASGARVLDAFCYQGGFSLAAIGGGAARVVAVDTSARALEIARQNLELNEYPATAVEFVHGEAGKYMAETAERFDLIVLDPPPLARSRGDAERAGRLYVELNSVAMRSLAPGGRLMTFSCSTHFRAEDFIRAVRFSASNAGRNLRLLAHLGPGPDHPVLLGHGEGEYLTGLLLSDL
ncbi:MAG: class I SAM-dependent rRNA methyltransferase [Candidatus Binatus sp.]|uniref:class I SAM-dependent rRNA methyltransferase n=1 Tax=Candidatus Binatus sp. TaxID=2811406 RepID=UPI003C795CAF